MIAQLAKAIKLNVDSGFHKQLLSADQFDVRAYKCSLGVESRTSPVRNELTVIYLWRRCAHRP